MEANTGIGERSVERSGLASKVNKESLKSKASSGRPSRIENAIDKVQETISMKHLMGKRRLFSTPSSKATAGTASTNGNKQTKHVYKRVSKNASIASSQRSLRTNSATPPSKKRKIGKGILFLELKPV